MPPRRYVHHIETLESAPTATCHTPTAAASEAANTAAHTAKWPPLSSIDTHVSYRRDRRNLTPSRRAGVGHRTAAPPPYSPGRRCPQDEGVVPQRACAASCDP